MQFEQAPWNIECVMLVESRQWSVLRAFRVLAFSSFSNSLVLTPPLKLPRFLFESCVLCFTPCVVFVPSWSARSGVFGSVLRLVPTICGRVVSTMKCILINKK